MSYITATQLAHQRDITAPTFTDTAMRLVYATDGGSYGYGASYTDGAAFACSFQGRAEPDAQPGTNALMVEADLYCAHDVTLAADDRVRITYLYGEAVADPQEYAIVAGPYIDGNVQHAGLRLVTE